MHSRPWIAAAPAVIMLLTGGCTATFVGQNSQKAMEMVVARARFDLECPDIRASIVSEKAAAGTTSGSEHTIDVQGCGKQAVYVAHCRDDQECNAGKPTGGVEKSKDEMP